MLKKRIAASFCALFVLTGSVQASDARIGSEKIRWSGEIRLDAPLNVAKGVVLELAPGTVVRPSVPGARIVVHGAVQVLGTATQPVFFDAPAGWQGIELSETGMPSSFVFAEFKGADVAISSSRARFTVQHSRFRDCTVAVRLVRESFPLVEDSIFDGNQIGIASETKSVATIRRNLFRGHHKSAILASHGSRGTIEKNRFEQNVQGIAMLQNYPDTVLNNTFIGNQTAVYCHQTQDSPDITGNTFVENVLAVANVSFASPRIRNNTFVDNETAIHNDQLGAAQIRHNLFRGNKTAIYNYRKSHPVVENNLLEENGLALFCDYSSYPVVHRNNFRNNRMGVKLGIYQSGAWEKRFGGQIAAQQDAARKTRTPRKVEGVTEVRDAVDVSLNWWGDDTAKLKRAGAEGNLEMFHDRMDQPAVVYEGFGPESYALDVIRYTPWLNAPVVDSGPVK